MTPRGEERQSRKRFEFRRRGLLAVLATVFVASLYGVGMYVLTQTGNAGASSFTSSVPPSSEPITTEPAPTVDDQLAALKAGVDEDAPKSKLAKLVKKIRGEVAANDIKRACEDLKAFVKQVHDLAAKKKIGAGEASSLIGLANAIKSTLGC